MDNKNDTENGLLFHSNLGEDRDENSDFDDIRPYHDDEIHAAMQRLVGSEFFSLLCSYIYPGQDIQNVRQMVLQFKTIKDFQLEVMKSVTEQVIARSITDFTFHGVSQLQSDKNYLFVSNHRDIVLDSCLMQYILNCQGLDTTEITFGANLMSSPLIVDIGKCNKMFRVERGGNMKDFYMSSMHLSEYIRYDITRKQQSVWIAQRNGRTKDGNDHTDQGIIKMFCLSRPLDKIEALAELNIIPVSVSYEWEPCDILKALELYESRFEKYVKKPGEDINSILTGIIQRKGRVNITLCPQITHSDLLPFDNFTHNEYHKRVAQLIDQRIISAYHLTPNNYIAHDLRYGQQRYACHYTIDQRNAFVHHLEGLNRFDINEPDVLRDIFLGIYANPLKNMTENVKHL